MPTHLSYVNFFAVAIVLAGICTSFITLQVPIRPKNVSIISPPRHTLYMAGDHLSPLYQNYRQKFESMTLDIEKLDDKSRQDIAITAQSLFDEMIEKYMTEDEESLKPELDIYNLLLKIYAMSPVVEYDDHDESDFNVDDNETMTELVLKRMEEVEDGSLPKPDTTSYLNVMEGWFFSKRYAKVIGLFDRLMQRSEIDPSIKPNTQLYNVLLRSLMKTVGEDSPRKAESYLSNMIRSFTEGDKNCRPTFDSFVFVMETFVRCNAKYSDTKIRQLIGKMTELRSRYSECADLVVNTTIRNVEIKALGQHKDKKAITEIDNIFQDMIASARHGDSTLKPDGATFVSVINSLKNNPSFASENRLNSLLALANRMYETGELSHDKNLYRIYNAALVTMARSKYDRKAEKTLALLEQMKQLKKSGMDCFSPDVRSYNSVLNACAYTKGGKSSKDAALRIAVSTFNELRVSTELEPNHVSYGTFLQVAGSLMEKSEMQDKLIETVFKKCRAEGHVSVFVLQTLTDVASPQLCTYLLGGDVEGEDGVSIPSEWSRNCVMEHVD